MRTDEVSQGAWMDSCSEILVAAKLESPWPGHCTVHLRQNGVPAACRQADAPQCHVTENLQPPLLSPGGHCLRRSQNLRRACGQRL